MQFIRNGPDIPERLLQAHEDGRVVFFCGAGISYPAGLPGFGTLVQRLFDALGVNPDALEQAAIKAGQFDTAIGLLEREHRIQGGRETIRRTLAGILTPDLSAPNATGTHEALLTLSRNRDGRIRLITTNFDRLFEEVIDRNGLTIERFRAPLLPVPKNRWDGLVYLHGLLPSEPTASDLDRLVVSSGDFGLAYLTERWAARFVSELFRNYIVCFVGYSINDPVMRYMMDALAADRLLGESPPEMFAFACYSKNKGDECANEWRAKNVTPILYRKHRKHYYLHKTLKAWAETYRDGISGKEQIVVQHALGQPHYSTPQDNFVGRVLWALSDASGLPAKRFAEITPAPSLDWLEFLSENRYGHDDLRRFGVPPLVLDKEQRILQQQNTSKLEFSLLVRPAPYLYAPYMSLVNWGAQGGRLDDVMWQLARWLLCHLDDPKLILWIAKRGGCLHEQLAWLIEHRLDNIARWEREGNSVELDRLRRQSPKAIPRPIMRTLWNLLLTGRVRSDNQRLDLYQWFDRLWRDGLTASARLKLRELLAPRIILRQPIRLGEQKESGEPPRLKDLVDWELVLATDHVHSALKDLTNRPAWQSVLPLLLNDFTALLRDVLDLMAELGGASRESDLSYMHQPSISEHPQNRDFHDWTALIELARDAWLATVGQDPQKALRTAEYWWDLEYPLFRRLAFFAAAQGESIPTAKAVSWLLADNAWWLWSIETQREALRLLVALAMRMDTKQLATLEQAILTGPPRHMFKDDLEDDHWARIVDREVWLRLAKLNEAGASLSEAARMRLCALSDQYPNWELEDDERDEFPFWMESGWRGEATEPTPRYRRDLVVWLREHPKEDSWKGDDWAERCRKNFATTACALCALAKEDYWPVGRWDQALRVWSEDPLRQRSWRRIAPILAAAPDHVFQSLAHSVSWWLEKVAKVFEHHEALFFQLCDRVLALEHPDGVQGTDDPVTRAINHPVGHVTEALLGWWYRRKPQNDEGLPSEITPIFTRLCDTSQEGLRHGRVLLAAHAVNLFLVDRNWTEQNLLPLFNWQRSEQEARCAWEGFLWSPRLYRPFLEAVKPALLETSRHYEALGNHQEQYVAFLTYAALDRGDTFTVHELRGAFQALPQKGLGEVTQALVRGLEGAGKQREVYWKNRIAQFWRSIWPKDALTSPSIANNLFRLCIAAADQFPAALTAVRAWLQPEQPVQHPGYLVHLLSETPLCRRFPRETLDWLDLLIDDQPWAPRELGSCLDQITEADPTLAQDDRMLRLRNYLRRRGFS